MTNIVSTIFTTCKKEWGHPVDNPVLSIRRPKMPDPRDRRFTDAEVTALPILARGSALRFLLTRLYDWLNQVDGALVRPKEPKEFWEKLRFHQTIKNSTDYGIR